jgi:hypothetical protein
MVMIDVGTISQVNRHLMWLCGPDFRPRQASSVEVSSISNFPLPGGSDYPAGRGGSAPPHSQHDWISIPVIKPLARQAVVITAATMLALGGGTAFATSAFAAIPTHSTAATTTGHQLPTKQKCSTKPASDPCHAKKKTKKHPAKPGANTPQTTPGATPPQ